MKVFVCTDHDGFYPVGVASIILAESEFAAQCLLRAALKVRGLKEYKVFTLKEISIEVPAAYILRDGDY